MASCTLPAYRKLASRLGSAVREARRCLPRDDPQISRVKNILYDIGHHLRPAADQSAQHSLREGPPHVAHIAELLVKLSSAPRIRHEVLPAQSCWDFAPPRAPEVRWPLVLQLEPLLFPDQALDTLSRAATHVHPATGTNTERDITSEQIRSSLDALDGIVCSLLDEVGYINALATDDITLQSLPAVVPLELPCESLSTHGEQDYDGWMASSALESERKLIGMPGMDSALISRQCDTFEFYVAQGTYQDNNLDFERFMEAWDADRITEHTPTPPGRPTLNASGEPPPPAFPPGATRAQRRRSRKWDQTWRQMQHTFFDTYPCGETAHDEDDELWLTTLDVDSGAD